MLDRQHGDVVFECDACGTTLETETSDFGSARNLLRREGWRARKLGDGWMHFCPKCDDKI
jgi:uncharacterized protein (DUF983 family)